MPWYIWLVLGLMLMTYEIFVPGFVIFWFGVAALCVMVLALLKFPVWFQLLSFAIFSLVFTLLSRKFFKKVVGLPEKVSGPERLIGKSVYVITPLKDRPNYYIVKTENDEWLAYSTQNLAKGEIRKVVDVKGNYLIIE
ncbi:MAG: NfeD family protein [candidate division WOR-3 bacterium]